MNSDNIFCSIASEIDQLTGLYTIQAFNKHVRELFEREPDRSFDCIAADMFDFKMTNALYGVEVGDTVLEYAGKRIKQANPHAIGARLGDRFFFIAPSDCAISAEECRAIVDDFRRYPLASDTIIQFGEYRNVDKSISVSAICDRALLAVASIKGDYSKRFARYDAELRNKKVREHTLIAKFENALATDQFKVFVQPKIDAFSGRVVEGEALVRWLDEDGNIIIPNDFIPLFERDGHIPQLDEYMFTKVCRYQRKRLEENKKVIPISVNLSRNTLFKMNMSKIYKAVAEEYAIDTRLVPLEITESYTIGDRHIDDILGSFADEGFVLEMDDFGAGYSSLAALSTLPFSVLKIDKSLNDRIGQPKGAVVLKHAVQMAHELGMSVIAEGIEKKEQVEFLTKIGCDTLQGFYYSKPVSIGEFENLIEKTFI